MEKSLAKQAVSEFKRQGGPELTVLEAVCMVEIPTDSEDKVYAIYKDGAVFTVKKPLNERMICRSFYC